MSFPECSLERLALPGLRFVQLHRHLLNDLNSKSLERRHFLGTVRQQPNAPQVEVRQNLRPNANLALYVFFAVVIQRGERSSAVKAERRPLACLFDRESLRGLVQVDQRSHAFLGDAPERAFQRGMAFASSRSENV